MSNSATQPDSSTCKKCNLTFETLSEAHSVDLKSRLRCNSSSSMERAQLAELLSEAKNDAARCDAEISRLHSRIISLENTQRQLRSRIIACSSLLSPIRRLPVEILVQIFSHGSGCNYLGTSRGPPPMLRTLGAVCAYWRSVMASTPKLWSIINAGWHFGRRDLDILKSYVQRSKQLPLSITVAESEVDLEASIMDILIPHSRRWVNVNLSIWDDQLLRETFMALKDNMPLVERLALHCGEEFDGTGYSVFEFMPRLHSLSLTELIPGISLPWEQIIHFSLDDTPVQQISPLLARCPRMETAHLGGCYSETELNGEDSEEQSDIITVTSPLLRSLTLSMMGWSAVPMDSLSILFLSVTLPSLRVLCIDGSGNENLQKWPQVSFPSFLSRSSCTLTALSLSNLALSDADLLAIFTLLPRLRDLTLANQLPRTSDSVIQSLCAYSSAQSFDFTQSVLLPKLQSIRLRACGTAFSDQTFVDMVKSRWLPAGSSGGSGIACLRSVDLHVTSRRFDSAKSKSLRHLAKAGMRISVTDSAGFVDICRDFV